MVTWHPGPPSELVLGELGPNGVALDIELRYPMTHSSFFAPGFPIDSDYAGASLDRKSTTGGCQFLGKRLISWQCKKQTVVANSKTEAEYVVAANCCGQVSWIQNQMLDYGFNFMNTKMALVMNLELKLVVGKVSTAEQKLVLLSNN
nr:putative ribonuclease H-like domain-containing protein [Tanacetum cinerariifolium]